jgi:hypothetical protein
MIMRCVAVVLVTAGCAWGLAGCKKGAKPDEAYKQNAQALVTALEAVRKDVEQKAPPQQLTKDYNAAQAARKTFEAACTPEQKELDSARALYFATAAYGTVERNKGKPDIHTPDPVGPASQALDAAKKFLEEGK